MNDLLPLIWVIAFTGLSIGGVLLFPRKPRVGIASIVVGLLICLSPLLVNLSGNPLFLVPTPKSIAIERCAESDAEAVVVTRGYIFLCEEVANGQLD